MKKMNNSICLVESSMCYGCSACMSICSMGAITMKENCEGFMTPVIDEKKCVNCGLCKEVCPALNPWVPKKCGENIFFAFQNNDVNELKSCTSGGAFMALRNLFPSSYVCGVVLDEDLYVKHVISKEKRDIEDMRGSKYVQSDLGDVLNKIGEKLKKGELVIFSGTSCQVHGLISYLEKSGVDTGRLITIDFICHGVPSNLMHREYISNYIKKQGRIPINHRFRMKKYGWGVERDLKNYIQTIEFLDKSFDEKTLDSQLYFNVFFSDYCLRECCYTCPYTCEDKPADITLADFWGAEYAELNIKNLEKGCSLIIARRSGVDIVSRLDSAVVLNSKQISVARSCQSHLRRPIARPMERDLFWADYFENGFEYVANKYFKYNRKSSFYLKIFNCLKSSDSKRIISWIGRRFFY